MRVFKYQPFFGWKLDLLFAFEGFALAAKVDRISAILLFTKNGSNRVSTPMVRYARRLAAVSPNFKVLNRIIFYNVFYSL